MPWFKVDDQLAFHIKTTTAGNAAMGLWVRAGSWCARYLTDGYVPDEIARSMGTKTQADRLCAARLWIRVDDGYQFHEWSEQGRQWTRAQVEQRAEQKRKAGRKGAETRWQPP